MCTAQATKTCEYTTTDTDHPTGTCEATNVYELKKHLAQHLGRDPHTIVVYDARRPDSLPLLSSETVADRNIHVQFEEPSVCITETKDGTSIAFTFVGDLTADRGLPQSGVCTQRLPHNVVMELAVRAFRTKTWHRELIHLVPERVERICWLRDGDVDRQFVSSTTEGCNWKYIATIVANLGGDMRVSKWDFTYWGSIFFDIPGTMAVLPRGHRRQQECGEVVTSLQVGFDMFGELKNNARQEWRCVFVNGRAVWRERDELHERAAKRQKC